MHERIYAVKKNMYNLTVRCAYDSFPSPRTIIIILEQKMTAANVDTMDSALTCWLQFSTQCHDIAETFIIHLATQWKKKRQIWNKTELISQNKIELGQKLTNEIISSVLFTSNDVHGNSVDGVFKASERASEREKSTRNYIKQLNYVVH